MPHRVSLEQKDKYLYNRIKMRAGITESAQRAGVSRSWAHTFESDLPADIKDQLPQKGRAGHQKAVLMQRPLAETELCDEAVRALGDFEFFRRRYMGHVSTPWQIEAAEKMVELLESDEDEFVVLNCPPGAGKTTLFTCDIPTWLIVRNRNVRILLGHRVQSRANEYSGRIRSILTRKTPVKADPRMVKLGLACDAEATLAGDFGPFKPAAGEDLWRREQFTVLRDDDVRSDEKESTVVAFGMDSGSLGYRADFIVWDDLFSKKIRTEDSVEAQREWFDDEAETRLEPGGVFALVAQRLAAHDLSRYCLDKEADVDDEEWLDADEQTRSTGRVYRHIIYPAHIEPACRGNHGRDASPYPGHDGEPDGGCLLDPRRLSWKKLLTKRAKPNFRVVYQQEDVDPTAVLVPKIWVDGGVDPSTGEQFVGCWDKDRRVGELPRGLARPILSIATADPSPSQYWAVQWWVVQPDTGLRYLMAQERRRMTASEFLDWDHIDRIYTGLMEEWFWWSAEVGAPIGTWVVEANAAQTFMFQYNHFREWMKARGVRVIRHTTHKNKADPTWGIEATLPPIYHRGLVRLPGSQKDMQTRPASMKLVDEVTRLPDGATTDDCAMAQWFLEYQLPKLRRREANPAAEPLPTRPGFLRRRTKAAA